MMSVVEEKGGGGQSRQGQQEKTKVIAIGGRGVELVAEPMKRKNSLLSKVF